MTIPTVAIRPTTFTRLRVAFETGRANIFQRIISLFAGQPVHVELVFNDGLSYSAADTIHGGVGTRFTTGIDFTDPKWTVLELDPKLAPAAFDLCVAEQGCPYDYYGLAIGWTYDCRPSPTRWFCSEVVSAALMHAGMLLKSQEPQYYTPRRLFLELSTPATTALDT